MRHLLHINILSLNHIHTTQPQISRKGKHKEEEKTGENIGSHIDIVYTIHILIIGVCIRVNIRSVFQTTAGGDLGEFLIDGELPCVFYLVDGADGGEDDILNGGGVNGRGDDGIDERVGGGNADDENICLGNVPSSLLFRFGNLVFTFWGSLCHGGKLAVEFVEGDLHDLSVVIGASVASYSSGRFDTAD